MSNFLRPNLTRAALPASPRAKWMLSAFARVRAAQRFGRLLPLIAILAACSQAGRSGDGREASARSTRSALTGDAVENVINGSFTTGMAPWWSYGMLSESATSGAYCAVSPASANVYDAGLGQDIALEAGVSYAFSFFVSGDPDHIHVTIQNPTTFAEYAGVDVTPTAIGGAYSATFTAPETLAAKIVFQVASATGQRSFCVDDVSLLGGVAAPVYTPDTGPRVRVNQVAYLNLGPKHATLVTALAEAVPWELQDAQGSVLMSGQSVPLGSDASSALTVHDIDFSGFGSAGEGLTLLADGETSFPFAIAGGHYQDLRVDALRVFYTQRSGQAIDGAVAGAAYARPAGHVSAPGAGSVNQGDLAVPCQPADISLPIYGEAWTCDYTLDVEGGWYDAGDHGKYVVNGGIAVYQLLSAFERTKLAPSTHLGALADGTLHVPETANGVPDVLDEARHELEFFLKMQVPAGKPLAGMVHHKVHDSAWTGLPLAPERDAMPRWLHRPSTAATLNLAATAAQGARLYAPYDRAFAKKLLAAALTAWRAAQSNPALFAPASDGASGGGAYDDNDVSDEFYWAAAELYLTTGKAEFRDFVLNSPLHSTEVFPREGFYWGHVAALARLDLASIPSLLPGRASVVASVVAAAHRYLDDQAANAFGQPYLPSGDYAWGSNSQVLNNLVVLGTAYDLTGDAGYQRGVLRGIDYLLGRNALNVSFVTGYGTVFSHNQHTRLYAHELDPTLPNPPTGTLSGGPNSQTTTWDPLASRLFTTQGCAPQFCYVDDIQSYATNELAINWNSALAWVASFVADQEAAAPESASRCTVAYTRLLPPRVALAAAIQLKNTGTTPIDSWNLSWSFLGDESVQVALGARVKQAGATVSVSPLGPNRTIKPGKSLTFYLVGPGGELADPDPITFFLNGSACSAP